MRSKSDSLLNLTRAQCGIAPDYDHITSGMGVEVYAKA